MFPSLTVYNQCEILFYFHIKEIKDLILLFKFVYVKSNEKNYKIDPFQNKPNLKGL